jgi:septal ring factor EnvC (AmiA/AmiB activator)
MIKPEIIKYSIEGAIVALLIILLLTMCSHNKRADDGYKELMAAKDTIIKKEHEKIDIYERLIEEKERTKEAYMQRDSVLFLHNNQLETSIKKINDQISHIPDRISKLSANNDSILRAYSEFE